MKINNFSIVTWWFHSLLPRCICTVENITGPTILVKKADLATVKCTHCNSLLWSRDCDVTLDTMNTRKHVNFTRFYPPASAIPRVVCKDYMTWTKPVGCKHVNQDLNFCDAKFRLYIAKRVKPQYALRTAQYKGRVVIVESELLEWLNLSPKLNSLHGRDNLNT